MRLAAGRHHPSVPGPASALADPVPLAEILRLCRPYLIPETGIPDGGSRLPASLTIASLESPEAAGPESLTLVGPGTPLRLLARLQAALVLAEPGVNLSLDPQAAPPPLLRVRSLHAALAALLQAWEERFWRPAPFAAGTGNRIASNAVVEGCLEGNVTVGPGVHIGRGSFVGAGSRIEANAVILEHCMIGRDCLIQSGAVIGCAGFGFYPAIPGVPADLVPEGGLENRDGNLSHAGRDRGLIAMPHLAGVAIGDRCWIGANTVVAAGVLHPTSLGADCKLDSHVQIAHNVRIGDGCLLASQAGIAGSTLAGDRLRMGGAASIAGHLRLGNDVSVAACSGVTKDQPDGASIAGFPAMPIKEWRLREIALRRVGKRMEERKGEGE